MRFFFGILPAAALLSQGFFQQEVQAAPSGASACLGGVASPGGPHTSYTPTNIRRLELTDMTFSVNGQVLCAQQQVPCEDDPPTLMAGETYTWEVTGAAFRGVLVRLEALTDGIDTLDALLTEDPMLQEAAACAAPVVGITHVSRDDKTSAQGTLQIDQAGQIQFDVNVVFTNTVGEGSSYAHDTFLVNFSTESEVTPSPVPLTDSPVTVVTPSPVPAITDPPVPATPAPTQASAGRSFWSYATTMSAGVVVMLGPWVFSL